MPEIPPKPLVLCVIDGFAIGDGGPYDAVAQARTPQWDRIRKTCPGSTLVTHGEKVGLPEGQMGNSEVGHMNIGAGRIVLQLLSRINKAFDKGEVKDNLALQTLVKRLKKTGGTCHLMGLVSDGGVHAHINHIQSLAGILAKNDIPVQIHAFTDGRDTPPQSGSGFIESLQDTVNGLDHVDIATVSGRYYAMDRDRRWERIDKAYRAVVEGDSPLAARDALQAVRNSYGEGVTDEFIVPTVIEGYKGMRDGDAVLCANFRSDRVRQILAALLDPGFTGFKRPRVIDFSCAAGMVEYSDDLAPYMETMFPPLTHDKILGEVLAENGLKQLRTAETEKYPHVTYFFNTGREEPFEGEERILVPSPKVSTYDLKPEMSAIELTDELVVAIDSGAYDFIVVNYANPDMVGHTGDLGAVITAVETVDTCLGRVHDAVEEQGGALIVTSDHGNADKMWDEETDGPHTAHTKNPVPFYICGLRGDVKIKSGILADIAPTILNILGVPQPDEMTGTSLIS